MLANNYVSLKWISAHLYLITVDIVNVDSSEVNLILVLLSHTLPSGAARSYSTYGNLSSLFEFIIIIVHDYSSSEGFSNNM